LIARLDVPLPDEVLNLPRDLPIVYFAMGSSGWPQIVARIIAGFAGKPYRVIAPVKYHLDKQSVQVPDNVLVTDWLPALEVNRLADIAVTHGGHGTVMNACLSGKPVVSVAISPEQFLNLEWLAAKGFAVRIPRHRLTPEHLCASIEKLLADKTAQEKARAYQKFIEEWDNPQRTRKFFSETYG
jgi:UDP:flavonoid glycosyltransferase YjiC (YdhE family)